MNSLFTIIPYNFFSYRLIQITIFIFSCFLIIVLTWQKPPLLQISTIDHYQCEIKNTLVSNKTFNILLPLSDYAKEFAERLCSNTEIGKQFSQVNINWRNRSALTADDLLKEKYQLIWARKDTLKGMVLHFDDIYQMLLPSQKVQIFWLSHNKAAELSPHFLTDKIIGLINDQKSFSSYLVPIDSLKKQGIDISKLHINYYNSYKSLYDAFNRHEIDLIPGQNWFDSIIDIDQLTQIPIQHQLESGELYAAKSIITPELTCSFIAAFHVYIPLFEASNTTLTSPKYCKNI
ncbi:hypothetical protein [Thalassotalea profundi]|uniref:hypothetical protein n=1 Tax=Thalassotalea profundi TaxID=2036687 RepID=UPI001E5B5D28|nr:hypothetical protein [Thalassotalea profundi]